jgi:hypothetical protein
MAAPSGNATCRPGTGLPQRDVGQGWLARFEDSFTGVVPATVGVDLSRALPSRSRKDPAGADRELLRHFVAVIDYPDFRNPIVTHLVEPVWKAMLAVARAGALVAAAAAARALPFVTATTRSFSHISALQRLFSLETGARLF